MKRFWALMISLCLMVMPAAWAEEEKNYDALFLNNLQAHLDSFGEDDSCVTLELPGATLVFRMQEDLMSLQANVDGERYELQVDGGSFYVSGGGQVYEIRFSEVQGVSSVPSLQTNLAVARQMAMDMAQKVLMPGLSIGQDGSVHFEATFAELAAGLANWVDGVLADEQQSVMLRRAFGIFSQTLDSQADLEGSWPMLKQLLLNYSGDEAISFDWVFGDVTSVLTGEYRTGETIYRCAGDLHKSHSTQVFEGTVTAVTGGEERLLGSFNVLLGMTTTIEVHTEMGQDLKIYLNSSLGQLNVDLVDCGVEMLRLRSKGELYPSFFSEGTAHVLGTPFEWSVNGSIWGRGWASGRLYLYADGSSVSVEVTPGRSVLPEAVSVRLDDADRTGSSFAFSYDGERITLTDPNLRAVLTWKAASESRFQLKQVTQYVAGGAPREDHINVDLTDNEEGWEIGMSMEGEPPMARVIFGPGEAIDPLSEQEPEVLDADDLHQMALQYLMQ